MQRAKLVISYFTEKEPEVEFSGEFSPDDICRIRYTVQMGYMQYTQRQGEENKLKVIRLAAKKAEALSQAKSAFAAAVTSGDLYIAKIAAQELLLLDTKNQEAMAVIAQADTVVEKPVETVA